MTDAVAAPPSTRRSLVFVYAGYAFRYLYLLILVPFYGRVLGAAEYGRLLTAMSLFQIVWQLFEWGFPTAGARDTAATTDPAGLARLYGQHMKGRLIMLFPALALGGIATLVSPVLRERPLFGILATLTGVVYGSNMSWYFQGTLRFRVSVLLDVLGFLINLVMILSLVRGPDDAWLGLTSLLISGIVCQGAAHVIVLRSFDRHAVRFRDGWILLRQCTALFAHRGFTIMMASSTTYLASVVTSEVHVGWYGAADRVAGVGLGLLEPASQVLVGTVARHLGALAREPEAYALMRKGFVLMSGVGLVMLVGTQLLAGTFLPLLMGDQFTAAAPILKVLALSFPFVAVCQVITGFVLIPLRQDSLVSTISLSVASMSVVLILVLGRSFDSMGVAWARLITYVVLTVVLLETLRRKQLFALIFPPRPGGRALGDA